MGYKLPELASSCCENNRFKTRLKELQNHLFSLYVKRTVNRQHFSAKFHHTYHKCPFTRSDFKDPILGSKIGSKRSDGPISRFCFCGENVGRSFVVCSHNPIFRTNKESSIWLQNDHRDIMQTDL